MKNYAAFRKFIFLISLIFAGTFNLFSQTGQGDMGMIGVFAKGCIISQQGDTIYGMVKLKSKFIENNIAEIQFKNSQGNIDSFDAGSIQGFGIDFSSVFKMDEPGGNQWDFYESKPAIKKGLLVFMNRFEKGKINVFQNRSSLGLTTTVAKQNSKFDGINFPYSTDEGLRISPSYKVTTTFISSKSWSTSYYFEKNNGGLVKIDKSNYENLWVDLFGDCPDIQIEIVKNPELKNFKNFILLVKVYNSICD